MAGPTPLPGAAAPVGALVRRLQHAHDSAWTRLVGPVLRGPEHAVLLAVRERPGIEQGSLAVLVSLQRSTMADVGRRLEQRGLLVRRTNPFDARSKLIELTPRGHATLQDVATRLLALDAALMDEDEDPAALLRRLEALADRWSVLGVSAPVTDPHPAADSPTSAIELE